MKKHNLNKIWWIEYSQGIDDYYNRKFVQAKNLIKSKFTTKELN